MKTYPKFKEESNNKINTLDLQTYFDDYMARSLSDSSGRINMSKENFKKMLARAKTEADF